MNNMKNLLDFMPLGVSHTDPLLNALMSDDEGEGGIANEIRAVCQYIDYISKTNDFHLFENAELKIIAEYFAGLSQYNNGNESAFRLLFEAVMQRGGAKVFGTKTDILGVFRTIMPPEVVVDIVENTGEENKLLNPDFLFMDENWVLEGSAELSDADCFVGKFSCRLFGGDGVLSQLWEATAGNSIYVAHIFIRGAARCAVFDVNENKYWNAETFEWQDAETYSILKSKTGNIADEWENDYIFIATPVGSLFFTLIFRFSDEECLIDHIRLYVKPAHPSFSLLLRYTGTHTAERTVMLDKTYPRGDPGFSEDYSGKTYIDNSFIADPVDGETPGHNPELPDAQESEGEIAEGAATMLDKTYPRGDPGFDEDYSEKSYMDKTFIADPVDGETPSGELAALDAPSAGGDPAQGENYDKKSYFDNNFLVNLSIPGKPLIYALETLDPLYPGGDPAQGEDYDKKAYFDHSPITGNLMNGTHEYFSFILDLIKPVGVQYFFDDNLLKEDS